MYFKRRTHIRVIHFTNQVSRISFVSLYSLLTSVKISSRWRFAPKMALNAPMTACRFVESGTPGGGYSRSAYASHPTTLIESEPLILLPVVVCAVRVAEDTPQLIPALCVLK
jgi:hypothetical protein